jgi:YYY domain-containing protein
MLLAILQWYLIVQLVSAASLPLCRRIFRFLPDKGYFAGKSFGVFSFGLVFWLANAYLVLDSSRFAAYATLFMTAALSFVVANRGIKSPVSFIGQQFRWYRRNMRLVVLAEVIFALGFIALIAVRLFDPAANHTEQPMDMTMLSGIWWNASFPPEDPWLAGYPISYYYLGYWLVAALGKLSGQHPSIAFNMGQAVWYGLLLTGVFGVGYNLGHLAKPPVGKGLSKVGALAGTISALAVGVSSNLQGTMEWFYAQGLIPAGVGRWFGVRGFPGDAQITGAWFVGSDWWWWRSSRVITDRAPISGDSVEVITEFPVFSYLLGDLHPHLLAMPFTVLLVALALNILLANRSTIPNGEPTVPLLRLWKPSLHEFAAAILMGSLIAINSWDFPACLLLVLLTVWASVPGGWHERLGGCVRFLCTAVILIVTVYWPYFLTAESQVQGIMLNFFNPTEFRQLVLVLGPFTLFVPCLVLWAKRSSGPIRRTWLLACCLLPAVLFLFLLTMAAVTLEATEMGVAFSRWVSAPFALMIIGGLLVMLAVLAVRINSVENRPDDQRLPTLFSILLTAVGLALILMPEVFYVTDYFNSRMNTLFKFYYQGWLMIGLGSSFGVAVSLSERGFKRTLASLSVVLLAACLLFAPAAAGAKTSLDNFNLDAMAHLGLDQRSTIRWIQENVPPGTRVLEAVGSSYDSDSNRFSTFTGRPTLLGWPGHEVQWRGSHYADYSAGRADASKLIYSRGSPSEIARAISDWNIHFIIVGPRERRLHNIDSDREAILKKVLDPVFESSEIILYTRRNR